MALTALSQFFGFTGLIAAAAFCWQIFILMNERDAQTPNAFRATTKWNWRSRHSLRSGWPKS